MENHVCSSHFLHQDLLITFPGVVSVFMIVDILLMVDFFLLLLKNDLVFIVVFDLMSI